MIKLTQSQHKQDVYIATEIFKGKGGGIFVDIGAHNGIGFSNTYFFEKALNWKGICIEPIPRLFKTLQQNRSCICLNIGISAAEEEVEFWEMTGWTEMLSGIVKNYPQEHIDRIERELIEYGGSKEVTTIKTMPLTKVLEENNMKHVDYCSIDVEGSELAILESIDFSKIDITCFSVENNYNNPVIGQILTTNGYQLVNTLVCDDIYLKA